eukprot:scaffold2858_cov659-Pavlova_lutheri.AAC.167
MAFLSDWSLLRMHPLDRARSYRVLVSEHRPRRRRRTCEAIFRPYAPGAHFLPPTVAGAHREPLPGLGTRFRRARARRLASAAASSADEQ